MRTQDFITLRLKIETDPILTDEEIEFVWNAMDRQYPVKVFKDGLARDIFHCGDCGKCVAKMDEYCWFCGQKLDWPEDLED